MDEKTNGHVSTRDFWLATFYIAAGGKYERADKTDLRHQVFHFSPVDGVDYEQIKQDYINGTLLLNAVKVKEANQRMKSEIHSV